MTEKSLPGGSAPLLVVQTQGFDRSLPAGPSYRVGRDPQCDIVITDARVSWQHAVLRLDDGHWLLVDDGSTNGTYAEDRRIDRIEIDGECEVRLGHPEDGPVLHCTVRGGGLDAPGRPATSDPSVVRPLPTETLRIGRALDNDIVVSDANVSRHHAELRKVSGAYRIVDLDSHHGTFVNGQRVTFAPLLEEDVVGIGSCTFRLVGRELQEFTDAGVHVEHAPP
ncbi:MAG: FHA domain-containing protein, partial [Mycobacteriaceae bacterium]